MDSSSSPPPLTQVDDQTTISSPPERVPVDYDLLSLEPNTSPMCLSLSNSPASSTTSEVTRRQELHQHIASVGRPYANLEKKLLGSGEAIKGNAGDLGGERAANKDRKGEGIGQQRGSTSSSSAYYGFMPYIREYALMREYKLLPKFIPGGIYVLPSVDSFYTWHGVVFVRSGIYAEGAFRFTIDIPKSYPDMGEDIPLVYFSSSIFHPLIDAFSGELNMKRRFKRWVRDQNFMWQVLDYIRNSFVNVECSEPFNEEAAKLFTSDMRSFEEQVIRSIVLSKEKIYEKEQDNPLVFKEWNARMHEPVKSKLLSGKATSVFDVFDDDPLGALSGRPAVGERQSQDDLNTSVESTGSHRRKHSGFSWVQESPKKK
eukprot:Nk52_evm20s1020 gene=Nk52_evmTU20s1020